MSYTHLTIKQRNIIEILRKENYSTRKIATLLGVHHATIARELKRCSGEYSSILAQKHAMQRNTRKGRFSKFQDKFSQIILSSLQKTWSPERIIGREFSKQLSVKTIYNWIYKGLLPINKKFPRRKGKTSKSKETRGKFIVGLLFKREPRKYYNEILLGIGN